MTKQNPSLADLLHPMPTVAVVDIGANPIDGIAPYKVLLDAGLARVIGFDLNEDALARLNSEKRSNEKYLPVAVFDGSERVLNICRAEGMTSLLEPNAELLRYFHGFPQWGAVQRRVPMPTVRLDEIKEIKRIDYLKIDIQGAELEVFRNGVRRLRDCLVIQTEVEFLQMYKGQPLFSEVELFLRELGFTFHRFFPLVSRTVQPMIVNNDKFAGLSQIFWADAVFIKDFTKFDELKPRSLKKLALILHEVYGSFDIVLRALMAFDRKAKSSLAEKYLQSFS
jgi:FkbM family methyltransferase